MIDPNDLNEPHTITVSAEKSDVNQQPGDFRRKSSAEPPEIKIITHIEDFEALEQGWKELAMQTETHIFQTFEWNRIWWNHFGTNKKLHIVALFSENNLVGLAPLFEDNVTLFGVNTYSCLRFLGSYVSQPEGDPLKGFISYSDYLNCIVHPRYEKLFYRLILLYFKTVRSEYDEIILDEVPEESTIFSRLVPLMEKNNSGLSYETVPASPSPVIQLNSTWDGYLNSLSVKDRYNARRYYKRSKQGNKKAFRIEKITHPIELPCLLSDLFRMHQQQWNSRGFAGTFSETRMRDFFTEITMSFYEKGWIEFNMAIPEAAAAQEYVAMDVYLTYKNRVYLMHRGMDEDSIYRKQGPGNVLLYARLREAIHDGVQVFDMLRGSEEFKLRMATRINQNQKITIRSGHKTRRLKPFVAKQYLNAIRRVRVEELHIVIGFYDKTFFRGVSDYIRFLHRRIKHKLFK